MDELPSLRKSAVRREVLSYLAKVNGSYVAEIAKATGHSPSQVIGALRGLKQGYKEESSLLALGLVEICGGGRKIYRITSKGERALELLKRLSGL